MADRLGRISDNCDEDHWVEQGREDQLSCLLPPSPSGHRTALGESSIPHGVLVGLQVAGLSPPHNSVV